MPPVEFGISVHEPALVYGYVRGQHVAEVAVHDEVFDGVVYPERVRCGDDLGNQVGLEEGRVEHLPRLFGVHRHARFGQDVLVRVQGGQHKISVHIGPRAYADRVSVVRLDEVNP